MTGYRVSDVIYFPSAICGDGDVVRPEIIVCGQDADWDPVKHIDVLVLQGDGPVLTEY